MSRPLALIEGDLALPVARPFDALPPPFGSRRRPAQTAAQREPQPGARTGAQQVIENAVQRGASAARRGPFPPGVKFLLFYKLPQRRDHSRRFDEQLAEARYYLEMGRVRPRSTRSDHLLGAAIFAGCSIALAWLLTTCTTHDAGKLAATAVTRPVALRSPAEFAGTIAQDEALAASSISTPKAAVSGTPAQTNATPKAAVSGAPTQTNTSPRTAFGHVPTAKPQRIEQIASHAELREPTHRTAPSRPAKADHPLPIVRFSKAQVDGRLALSRTANPATRPSASKSSEWTARSSSANETAERTALLDWAAQMRRATITTRTGAPTPGDTDWSVHMTQRRITDNPDAFQTGRIPK
jgi:hypothetical protein